MSSPETTPPEILGRSHETSLVRGVLGFAADAPRAVLFRGEPGVGKTALLDLAARLARAQEQHVIYIRGTEFESDIGYSGLNQAVMALEDYLELLTPGQRDCLQVVFGSSELSEAPSQLAVYSAVSALFAAAEQSGALLICLDDLQWIDRASADGFLFVARRLDGTSTSIVASARSAPGWLDSITGIRVVEVEPLDLESADLLLRRRFPALAARVRRRLVSDSEGNPLALLELPHAIGDVSEVGELPTNLPLTRRLHVLFTARINSLPDETREFLLTSALHGTGELSVIRRAVGDPGLRALSAAEDAGFVKVSAAGARLTFRHPLMRSAVAEHATADQKREAHRKLADAQPLDIERRARHLAAATLEPDETVAEVLHAAARRAAKKGVEGDDAAMRLLIRSADLSPSLEDQRKRMAEAAFIGAFRYASPSPQLLERVPDPRPGSDEALWAASASAFLSCHRMNDLNATFRLLDSVLDAAVIADNTVTDAYRTAVEAHLLLCTFADSGSHSDRFEAWTRHIRDPALSHHFKVLTAMLDPARSAPELVPVVDTAIEQALTSTDPRNIGIAAGGSVYLDRLFRCRAALEKVADLSTNGPGGDIPVRVQLTIEAFQSGRWDDAVRLAEGGIELSATRSTPLGTAIFGQRLALVAAVRGDSHSLAFMADSILTDIAGRGYLHIENEVHFAVTLDAVAREDHLAAFDAAVRISRPGELARGVPTALWVFFELVFSAVLIGRVADASAHVEAVRVLKVASISPHYALMVAASEAMLLDRGESSAAHLGPFLEHPEVRNWPFDLARMRLVQAEFLIADGRPVEASDQISQAVVVLRGLGAAPWIEIADRLSHQILGVAQKSNGLGLTATELKVVRLAASGLTNKQIGAELFLSARTVSSHLYRAFPKLGITRRAALRDAVARIDKED